jgi:hypothetical protein
MEALEEEDKDMRHASRKYRWTVLGVLCAVFIVLSAAYAQESVRTSIRF